MRTTKRLGCKPIELLFCGLSLIFGMYFVFATPLFWGIDESTHFLRAYQLSQGGITAQREEQNYGGSFPANLVALRIEVGKDLTAALPTPTNIFERHDFDNNAAYHALATQPLSAKKTFVELGSGEVYSPLSYVPAIVALKTIAWAHPSIQTLVYAARIASLIAYIAVVVMALRTLMFSRLRWLVFCVALLPMTLYQASILSADTGLNALCLLAFALIARGLLKREPLARWQLVMLCVAAIQIPLIKINYLPVSIALLLLPQTAYRRITQKIPAWLLRTLLLLAVLVSAGVWLYSTRHLSNSLGQQATNPPISASGQLHFMASHPLSYLKTLARDSIANETAYLTQTVGYLGWNYVTLPLISIIASYTLLLSAGLYKDNSEEGATTKWQGGGSLLLGGLLVVGVLTAFYVTFSGQRAAYISGVQGRYFIPALAFIFYGIGRLLPIRMSMDEKQAIWVFGVANALCLFVAALYVHLAIY